ncbi:MAG TPA: dCMP deaminase family protein [Longimicrobiales bacterium]
MEAKQRTRPDRMEYYMGIAMAVRRRANCVGSRVGAILVLNDRIISTGYNGTPQGMPNCDEGGCERCAHREKYRPAQGYDLCICVHAEQNALLSAARFGIPVEGSVLYTTMRPCFGCAKELLQARIHAVYYLHDWRHPDDEMWRQYERLERRFPGGSHAIQLSDPDAAWAVSSRREAGVDSGHGVHAG